MIEIPDALRSVFSATVRERDGGYVIEIPSSEIQHDALAVDGQYRVALYEAPDGGGSAGRTGGESAGQTDGESDDSSGALRQGDRAASGPPSPPVEEGDVRDVTIETLGEQGDGIAKVERGYVVIVPETTPGQQPTVEIEQVRENVAFASVVESEPRT